MKDRSYYELQSIPTFLERFEYLKLSGSVGLETFGYNRNINQDFYHSEEWRRFRDRVIVRDGGCDLGVSGYEIHSGIYIHHINPITIDDIINCNPKVLDMNNVIVTRLSTHNAIHYGDKNILVLPPKDRAKNDTCPWKN